MKAILCFIAENWTLVIPLIVGLLALIIGYVAVRLQILSHLSTQLAHKSLECNGYLDPRTINHFPQKPSQVSGILSAIITAEELFYYRFKLQNRFFTLLIKKQPLIDKFYLQLHTTIRTQIKNSANLPNGQIYLETHVENDKEKAREIRSALNIQYTRARSFLFISLQKCSNLEFEKLQKYSLKRNKKYLKKTKKS